MIQVLIAAALLAGYAAYRAVGAHARHVARDQAEIAAWKPLMHGEPPRNVETSRWATPHNDEGGRP